MESEFTFRFTVSRNKCFSSFADFRKKIEFCDVVFTVGTHNFPAHRVIVAAAMPSFQDVLRKEYNHIEIPATDPLVFERLIDFAYGYELQITMENVRDLLSGACRFHVNSLREACCDFVAKELRPENALNFRKLADEWNYSRLREITDRYIKEHFTEIYRTEFFLNCSDTYIMELIGKEDLKVDREEKAFEAVLRWVKACPDDRKKHLPNLLRQVRMPLMESDFLTEVVEREELIRSSLVNWKLVREAKNYILNPQSRNGTSSFPIQPRRLTTDDKAGGQDDSASICKMTVQVTCSPQNFDFTCNAWHTKRDMTYTTAAVYATKLSRKMYFNPFGLSLTYDPESNEYQHFQGPSIPRYFAGVASLKGKMYVCGGTSNGQNILNIVECFNPETNKWSEVKNMNIARYGLAAVALGDHIYVLGGVGNFRIHNTLERYSSVTGVWTTLEPMLSERCFHGACVLNGKIYACGGNVPQSSLPCVATAEVYDPVGNQWESIAPMNTSRHTFILLSCRGKLYAFGGIDENVCRLHSCEIYDPESNKWSPGAAIDHDYYASAAIVT